MQWNNADLQFTKYPQAIAFNIVNWDWENMRLVNVAQTFIWLYLEFFLWNKFLQGSMKNSNIPVNALCVFSFLKALSSRCKNKVQQ